MPTTPPPDPESTGGTDAQPEPGMYLANLIADAVAARSKRGAPWLAENALDPDTGQAVFTRQSAHNLMRTPKRAFMAADEIRAVASLFGWSTGFVIDACAINLGISVSRSESAFAGMIPAGVDDLPVRRQVLLRDLLIAVVEDNHLMDR